MSREVIKTSMPKTGWGAGPWMYEPDEVAWTDDATGLACNAKRNSMGAWCGYVGVPPEHSLFAVEYSRKLALLNDQSPEDILGAHGGITYSSFHTDLRGRRLWWYGFDCNHWNDLAPKMAADLYRFTGHARQRDHEVYRDLEYVKLECAQLALQLDVPKFKAGRSPWLRLLCLWDYFTLRKRRKLWLRYWSFRFRAKSAMRTLLADLRSKF